MIILEENFTWHLEAFASNVYVTAWKDQNACAERRLVTGRQSVSTEQQLECLFALCLGDAASSDAKAEPICLAFQGRMELGINGYNLFITLFLSATTQRFACVLPILQRTAS